MLLGAGSSFERDLGRHLDPLHYFIAPMQRRWGWAPEADLLPLKIRKGRPVVAGCHELPRQTACGRRSCNALASYG